MGARGTWVARRQEAGEWEERRGISALVPPPFPGAGGAEWAGLQCGGADFSGAQSRVVKCILKVGYILISSSQES